MQKYIDHCREQGLTNASLLMDIEDAIADLIIADGCGWGSGYCADEQDTLEAQERAARIARRVDGKL